MAIQEHLEIVNLGAAAIALWKNNHVLQHFDLSNANLSQRQLEGANLFFANLTDTRLNGANLSRAVMANANLISANLEESDLYGAVLALADLKFTNLSNADCTEANFLGTLIFGAKLDRTKFRGSVFNNTIINDCDLSNCIGIETANHTSPSSIGLDTLVKTFRGAGNRWTPELMTFFLGAGVPKEVLEGLPSIIGEVKFYSSFIAYGEPDREFAERLYRGLKARGVSCWVYSMDSTPGERTWGEIIKNRREAEKFIVLCSAPGLIRDGVLKEIEEQMDEDQDKIVPISLDDIWEQPGFRVMRGSRDLKPFLMERNYADFGEGRDYEQALQRLLRALERKDA